MSNSKNLTLLLLGLTLVTPGCLEMETSNTLFVEPDGAAAWVVRQANLRSEDPTEEAAFLEQAAGSNHDVARALYSLGAYRVDSRILRSQRPYEVETTGHFVDVSVALRLFLESFGPASAALTHQENLSTLRFSLAEDDREPADDDPMLSLISETYRFVLTEGRFVGAEGFELSGGGTVAVLDAGAEPEVFVLTWESVPSRRR